MRTFAERNLAAEVRFVESGHRAFVGGGAIKVVSDTYPGKHYVVTFTADYAGSAVTFTCQPHGTAAYSNDHLVLTTQPGLANCLHTAGAARRLEREGLVELRLGVWVATAKAAPPEPPSEVGAAILARMGPRKPTEADLVEGRRLLEGM